MTARRVLVTGASGFLGRAVVKVLSAAGKEVTALSRRATGASSLQVDLTDARAVDQALRGANVDAVCHLAARTSGRESVVDPLGYWTANLTGTVNLLRALEPGTPVVMASTAAVYAGDASGALNEDTPARPGNPYGASKYAAEEAARAWSTATGSPVTVLRCFNIGGAVDSYGDPDGTRLIPALINAAAGRSDAFTMNGDGSTVRDYCHVLDVADSFALALTQLAGEPRTFNVGTGEGLSVAQLVDALVEVTGRPVPVRHAPARSDATRLVADTRRIFADLGWVPTRSTAKNLIRDAWEAGTSPTIELSAQTPVV